MGNLVTIQSKLPGTPHAPAAGDGDGDELGAHVLEQLRVHGVPREDEQAVSTRTALPQLVVLLFHVTLLGRHALDLEATALWSGSRLPGSDGVSGCQSQVPQREQQRACR